MVAVTWFLVGFWMVLVRFWQVLVGFWMVLDRFLVLGLGIPDGLQDKKLAVVFGGVFGRLSKNLGRYGWSNKDFHSNMYLLFGCSGS